MSGVALITGAAQGIGRAIAERLVADGMQVTLTDRDQKALDRVKNSLAMQGREVDVFEADLSDMTSVAKLIPAVLDRWGRIDTLVLNAAYHGSRRSVLEIPISEWKEIFAVSVLPERP